MGTGRMLYYRKGNIVMPKEIEIEIPPTASGKRILHVVCGNEEWEPTQEELTQVGDLFFDAIVRAGDNEKVVVATRDGVAATVLEL